MIRWVVVLAVLMCAGGAGAAAQEGAPVADYVIGPGDLLLISVWKDEALTRQVTVLPDGKIGFPLIGHVTAAGRSVTDLSKELEQKLAKFVPGVDLSVVVHQVNSLMVYVIGRVNQPGRFALNTDVNVLQALAMAGGLNPFAKRGDIKIFREVGGGTKVMFFDYDTVADGKDPKQNIRLMRGDVIVVP
jgi:polysaccharide export outer membrane protein